MTSSKSKLFLSYARSDDEPFVARLYRDLTAAGFDVWFDRVSLPSRGLTFHQEIRDAIAARERLLLVVGPKAASSEYVQQEWQFAWFEAEKIVTPILRLGDYPLAIPELALLHAEDFRDDAQYDFHLQHLVAILGEAAPPLGKLIGVPSLPPHYLSRTDRLIPLRDAVRSGLDSPTPFGGAAARQQFHGIAGTSKHIGMHGMGGIGKSVLANLLARDREIRKAFPDGIVWVGLGSVPVLADLMRRMHRDLGGDGAFANEHEGKTKLKELLADKALLLIIDDAWRREDVDAFDVLGPRCRALITTRDAGLLTSLGGTHHLVELLTDAEALRLLAVAVGQELAELPTEAHQVLQQCGRLPLAVALAGGLVAAGTPWASLQKAFERHKLEFLENEHSAEPQHRNLWKTIEISVQALPDEAQKRLVELAVFPEDEAVPEAAIATLWEQTGNLDDLDTQQLLVKLKQRSLIQVTASDCRTVGRIDNPSYKQRSFTQVTTSEAAMSSSIGRVSTHDLIHDYCVRRAQALYGKVSSLHDKLLAAYERTCPDGWHTGPNDGYFLDHLRTHLVAAGRGGELADLLHELPWLEAKNDAGLTFDLPHDFSHTLNALPDDDDRYRILKLLDEALQRDIHFIARHREDYPQALFQCLWNTGWWYDSPQAAAYYVEPEQGWPETGPHWNHAGARLTALVDTWRARKVQADPDLCWVRSLRPPPMHLGTAQLAVLRGHESRVTSVAYSPDSRRIASGSNDDTARVWDAASGEELAVLRGHEGWVTSVAYSPDGRRIASGSWDKTVRVWDPQSGAKLALLRGHENSVESVCISPDGRRIASGSWDKTVWVWDAQSGSELAVLRGHEEEVTSVCFSPDGRRIASGSWDKTVRVWDPPERREAGPVDRARTLSGKCVFFARWPTNRKRLWQQHCAGVGRPERHGVGPVARARRLGVECVLFARWPADRQRLL